MKKLSANQNLVNAIRAFLGLGSLYHRSAPSSDGMVESFPEFGGAAPDVWFRSNQAGAPMLERDEWRDSKVVESRARVSFAVEGKKRAQYDRHNAVRTAERRLKREAKAREDARPRKKKLAWEFKPLGTSDTTRQRNGSGER